MFLLVGLGNPGREYAGNRHNIGFMAVDAIARAFGFPAFRKRFQGEAGEGMIGGQRAVLLKPLTFMNDSGQSVGQAAKFQKIPLENIIVIHDDLDLAPAKLRIKTGGGEGGHNGLRSITAHVGKEYRRARLGIGHPGDKARVHDYVLSDFAKSELPWVETLCGALAKHAEALLAGDDSGVQNKVHLAMRAAGFGGEEKPGGAEP